MKTFDSSYYISWIYYQNSVHLFLTEDDGAGKIGSFGCLERKTCLIETLLE